MERVTHIEDKRKDLIKERSTIESVRNIMNEDKERDKIRKGMVKETLEKFERPNSERKEVICRKLDVKDEIEKDNNSNDGLKEMVEKQNNKQKASSVQIICKKLEIEKKNKEIVKEILKKENSTLEESLHGKLKEEKEQERTNTIV